MKTGIRSGMFLDVVHNLRDPRRRHHHAERPRSALLQHLFNSHVRIVRHARIVHVKDQYAVAFLPAEFLGVGLRQTSGKNRQREQQSLRHAASVYPHRPCRAATGRERYHKRCGLPVYSLRSLPVAAQFCSMTMIFLSTALCDGIVFPQPRFALPPRSLRKRHRIFLTGCAGG